MDSDEHVIILGYPWLEAVDPQISFRSKEWRLPSVRYNSEDREQENRSRSQRRARAEQRKRSRSDGEQKKWRSLSVRQNSEEHEPEGPADLVSQSATSKARSLLTARTTVWSQKGEEAPALQWRYSISKGQFELQSASRFLRDTEKGGTRVYSLCVSDVYAGEKPSEHQDTTIGSTENSILLE